MVPLKLSYNIRYLWSNKLTRFHFERPDGNPKGENILLHLNPFIAPQGYGGGGDPPPPTNGLALVQTGTLSALVQTGTLTALIQTGSG